LGFSRGCRRVRGVGRGAAEPRENPRWVARHKGIRRQPATLLLRGRRPNAWEQARHLRGQAGALSPRYDTHNRELGGPSRVERAAEQREAALPAYAGFPGRMGRRRRGRCHSEGTRIVDRVVCSGSMVLVRKYQGFPRWFDRVDTDELLNFLGGRLQVQHSSVLSLPRRVQVATRVLQDAVKVFRQVENHDTQVSPKLCCVAFFVRWRVAAPPIPISKLQSAKNHQLLERKQHTNHSKPVGRVFNRVHKPAIARNIHCRCYVGTCVSAAFRNTVACDEEVPFLLFMKTDANAVSDEKRRRPQDVLCRQLKVYLMH